jgi:hypothetical protein
MATALTILAVSTIAGYCVGKYYGRTPCKDKTDTPEDKEQN